MLGHIASVQLSEEHVSLTLIGHDLEHDGFATKTVLHIGAVRIRRGHDIRLVVAAPLPPIPKRNSRVVQLVAEAITTRLQLQRMEDVSIAQAAAWLSCSRATLTDRIKLSYLAPDIVDPILAGRQPRSLTRQRIAAIELPIEWGQQRTMLGFG